MKMWPSSCGAIIIASIWMINVFGALSWPGNIDTSRNREDIDSAAYKYKSSSSASSNEARLAKSLEIRNYMNLSVDPCEDFYEYACGKWGKHHPATLSNRMTSRLDILREEVDAKVNDLLAADNQTNDDLIDRKVKDFYASCMNTNAIRRRGTRPLLKLISDFGGMPALDEHWNETAFNWLETIAKLRYKYGMDIIIGLDIIPDLQNNDVNRIYVGEPKEMPLLTKSMYMDESTKIYRDRYTESISTSLAEELDVNQEIANQTAKEIVHLEVQLASGMHDHRMGFDFEKLFKERTIADLSEAYAPAIDFEYFLRTSLGEEVTTAVYETGEDYLPQLVKVIRIISKKTLANYIMWQAIEYFRFSAETDPKKRRKLCAQKTTKFFSKVVGNMFYRKYNSVTTDEDVNLIWFQLKEALRVDFTSDNLNWISSKTRQKAINKLDSITMKILSYRTENFTRDFGELQVKRANFLENIMSILELEHRKQIEKLHKQPEPLAVEDIEASSVNAAYIVMENKIKIPLGILQPKFWNPSYPYSIKFGTIGFVVAHELIHGFDDIGRNFDETGNMRPWWDENSTKEFQDRTKCFNQQYNTYRFDDRQLPASEIQTENIADNAGLKIAFTSYMKWLANTEDRQLLRRETLPDLDFTNTQLFFLSYAQLWCTEVHPSAKLVLMMIDDHVPGKFRVNVPLSNFKEFAREFKCLPGTDMNPGNKCSIY